MAWMPEGTPSLLLAYQIFSARTVSAGVEPAAGSRGATSLDPVVPSVNGALPALPRAA